MFRLEVVFNNRSFLEKMYNMNRLFFSVLLLALLVVSCQSATNKIKTESNEEKDIVTSDILTHYANDTDELFVYKNNTFQLVETKNDSASVRKGNLNYERGFSNDIDATLFVLDFDKPSKESYFVKFSNNDSIIIRLDSGAKGQLPDTLYLKR